MTDLLKAWAPVGGLIFGGCCSNVFALERIIKEEPSSGLLVTFVQFIIVALFTWPSQFSRRHPPFYLKPLAIPLSIWAPSILMFFAVNLLNNMAFSYKISVPMHIILRSGGSILTMLVGFVWGKRYSTVQVLSVCLLTVGIIIAASADAQAKGKISTNNSDITWNSEVLTGLSILFVAQLLSAIMGLYVQLTYDKYGKHWLEYLFYSHLLSIPLFLPFKSALNQQLRNLVSASVPVILTPSPGKTLPNQPSITTGPESTTMNFPSIFANPTIFPPFAEMSIPPLLQSLALNALTQYACIRGVNLLAASTSALGVTIVLNVRKLASLFLSIWLFGNRLPPLVAFGATIVFGSAGLWAWEDTRLKRAAAKAKAQEAKEKEKKTE